MAAPSNSIVSYLHVYKDWLHADLKRNHDSTIPIDVLLPKLLFGGALTKSERQRIDHETADEEKLSELFLVIMPAKGEEGFNKVVEILRENANEELASDLMAGIDNRLTNTKPVQTQLVVAQVFLSRLIRENLDFMAKYWSDVIRVAQTDAAFVFVDVQVLEHFKSESGAPVGTFREIFEKDESGMCKRIVIQGDPGCGKTTYVNKLALDWAKQDEYLRETFDFVFLIALQSLNVSIESAIECFLPKKSKSFFQSYAESAQAKVLLILDGFDELDESSAQYASVVNVLKGNSSAFQFFTILLTTRRSHVDKIPQNFRERSLLIKGFGEESLKLFLQKQQVPIPSVGKDSSLSVLLQTPLFCVIYCSLYSAGEGQIDLEDSYDFVKAMVENCVANTGRIKTVLNADEQLDECGKFALQLLRSGSLEVLNELFSNHVDKPSFDLSKVNLDLLIKKKVPTAGINRFKEEFSFPHQLLAEYLAARYFVRSLTKKQLECANPEQFFRSMREFPLAKYIFFELLSLFLDGKFPPSAFSKILKTDVLRIFWQCKSQRSFGRVVDVTVVNFSGSSSELMNHSRFFPTLSKFHNISSLNVAVCHLSINQQLQFALAIEEDSFKNLVELDLSQNDISSTSGLLVALRKCKKLQKLFLSHCKLTVESTDQLAKCIDGGGLQNLMELDLSSNDNVGSTQMLFEVLHFCLKLNALTFDMTFTGQSLDTFLATFNSNTFQDLSKIQFKGYYDQRVDDNFKRVVRKYPTIDIVGAGTYHLTLGKVDNACLSRKQ